MGRLSGCNLHRGVHTVGIMLSFLVAAAVSTLCVPTQLIIEPADDPIGAVVFLHGWSQGLDADNILPTVAAAPVVGQMLAAGWSVYAPFLDSDWGSGLDAVNDAIAEAHVDGFDQVRVVGVSAGALTALNWAWRNPDAFTEVYLITPVFDLAAVHAADTPTQWPGVPSATASIDARYPAGFTDFDPTQHDTEMSVIADRVSVFAARDDEIIDWTSLLEWSTRLGIDVVPSAPEGSFGGGHIFASSLLSFKRTIAGWFGDPR